MRLIDADALRATLHKYFRDKSPLPRLAEAYHADVMGAIKNAPTISPIVQWHDAKTDPPSEDGRYMVYAIDGDGRNYYDTTDFMFGKWWWADKMYSDCVIGRGRVTHWAELPAPPEVNENAID